MNDAFDKVFEKNPSTVGRDLKLNFKKLLEGNALDEKESTLALTAIGASLDLPELVKKGRARLGELDFSQEQIEEAVESAAIVGMLNFYYRFKHMVTAQSPEAADRYRNAGLRMTALAKPSLGKERFEMLAFAISVVNGCETCVAAHERTLREAGVPTEKIHDLARLTAVIKGIQGLINKERL